MRMGPALSPRGAGRSSSCSPRPAENSGAAVEARNAVSTAQRVCGSTKGEKKTIFTGWFGPHRETVLGPGAGLRIPIRGPGVAHAVDPPRFAPSLLRLYARPLPVSVYLLPPGNTLCLVLHRFSPSSLCLRAAIPFCCPQPCAASVTHLRRADDDDDGGGILSSI